MQELEFVKKMKALNSVKYRQHKKKVLDKIRRHSVSETTKERIENYGKSQGKQNDAGKAPWHLISWKTIAGITKVLQWGVEGEGYDERNWEKGISYCRTFGSLIRHLVAWYGGEEYDKKSGLPHLDHVLCRLMMLRHYTMFNKDMDDRVTYETN